MLEQVETITVSDGRIRLVLKQSRGKRGSIEIPWTPKPKGAAQVIAPPEAKVDQKLVKSIIRAHAWLDDLSSGRHASIEDLAAAADLHPKVVRQGLRLAFLPPDLTRAALDGEATIELKQIPKLLPLSWREQHIGRLNSSIECYGMRNVSDGARDDASFVIALCPNCHRRLHADEDGEIYNSELLILIGNNKVRVTACYCISFGLMSPPVHAGGLFQLDGAAFPFTQQSLLRQWHQSV